MSESPAQLAVRAMREWLLSQLPAKVAAVNAQRPAEVYTATVQHFAVPADAVLRVGTTREGGFTDCPMTAGSRTAHQVAADINAAAPPGVLAVGHNAGHVILRATSTPTVGAPSCVAVGPDSDGTGVNAAFGWATGGEHVVRAAIEAPTWRGVTDGDWTLAPDRDGGGFWVVIGDRTVRPWPGSPNVRRDEYLVTLTLDVIRRFGANQTPHRDREAIGACLRCVDEVLRTTEGRQLGRAGAGDVMLTDVVQTRIAPRPFDSQQGFLFDVAQMTLTVRIFQRAQ